MADKNPKESTKKRVVLPDPIKFLENILTPDISHLPEPIRNIEELGQSGIRGLTSLIGPPNPDIKAVEDSVPAQLIMGYLGPPGHVPKIRAGYGSSIGEYSDVIARLSKFLENVHPTLARTARNIDIVPSIPSKKLGAVIEGSFDPVLDNIRLVYPSRGLLESNLTHELGHGLDFEAGRQLFPQISQGWPAASELLEFSAKRGTKVSPTQLEGRLLFKKLDDEARRLSHGSHPLRYGKDPVINARRREQFATIGTTEPPTNWKALIQALIGIVEGRY